MAWKQQYSDYVKFLRGTPAFWEQLTTKDPNTLYFISETSGTTGKLYLGNKLIGGGGEGSSSSLSDLDDILIEAGINAPSLLVYDTTALKWKPKTVAEIIAAYVKPMIGATENEDGEGGLVPQPEQGQQNLFLRGDATWANPVSSVESSLNTIVGNDAGKTIRQVASEEVAKVVASAPTAFDTLKEIADWIDTHDATGDVVTLQNNVSTLQNTVYGTGNNDGLVAVVSNFQTDLSGLTTRVGNLEDTVEDIDLLLRWQDFTEE